MTTTDIPVIIVDECLTSTESDGEYISDETPEDINNILMEAFRCFKVDLCYKSDYLVEDLADHCNVNLETSDNVRAIKCLLSRHMLAQTFENIIGNGDELLLEMINSQPEEKEIGFSKECRTLADLSLTQIESRLRVCTDDTLKPNQITPNKDKPLALAASHFIQAMWNLENNQFENFLLELKHSSCEADQAFEIVKKRKNLSFLATVSKLKMVIDVLILSFDGEIEMLTPYKAISIRTKFVIREKLMSHLDELKRAKEKMLLRFMRQSDKLIEERTNIMDKVYRSVFQYIAPPGCPLPVAYVPDGREDAAVYNIHGDPQRKRFVHSLSSTLVLWKKSGYLYILHSSEGLVKLAVNELEEIDISVTDKEKLVIYHELAQDQPDIKILPRLFGCWLKNGRAECLKYFNICYKTSNINRMLLAAADEGDLEALKNALDIFAYVNSVDKKDRERTALHKALFNDNVEIVKMLLDEVDIDLNKEDVDKFTPLHMACAKCCLENVKLLVESGADTHKLDYAKRTPFEWAEFLERDAILRYIESL